MANNDNNTNTNNLSRQPNSTIRYHVETSPYVDTNLGSSSSTHTSNISSTSSTSSSTSNINSDSTANKLVSNDANLRQSDIQKSRSNLTGQHTGQHSGEVNTLELLEERAVVDKERLNIGQIKLSKQRRTKTVTVPIELTEEVLVIETQYHDTDSKQLLSQDVDESDIVRHIEPVLNNTTSITVNGEQIALDEGPIEVMLSREVAMIKKETYAVQDIAIEKSVHTHKESFDVELQHEELDVAEQGDVTVNNLANNDLTDK
ncbi:YsnF/AvaK domain-containing protein [Psychrobacter sp. FDAARGOS_221]|uniref:YsnF/AvaK domain-containing protein n=1 Tax=Psychrobacter sp. FDAARGOS_221 TaxID=1975705 RepID=UPI000BB59BB5|nr:YsnF/AvaK domain-containing protein [Psychrobacter sp. FDAARGOS_221]PNK61141.1 DUF2382 domain-containing protein [Psychrobacter sp. FDAARGOS_221]